MGEKDKVKAGHRKNKIKYSVGDHIFQAINYAVFTLITLICVYPFYYIVINTISDNKLVDLGRVMFYPIGIHFDNYVNIMKLPNMGTGAINSVARTVIGTVLGTLITSYMAYLFTKEELWGRKVWYRLTVATMYFSAGLIPGYLNIKMLGLMNTFWVYIIPNLISVYNMVLVKTYIESLPASLEESAQIDGAGYFRRFAVIVLPLCVPILATIALYSAVGHWNNFMDCLLYIQSPKLYTLQYILNMYFRQAAQLAQQIANGTVSADESALNALTPTSVKLTVTVVITVPILLVYPFVQRYFVKGIMVGAVKG